MDRKDDRINFGRIAWFALLMAFCVAPYVPRIRFPSLYADDVVRVVDLRTQSARFLLSRPVNEHLAPLFECVSIVTWNLAGRRLAHAAVAFTLASYVPFILTIGALWLFLRRWLGSKSAAWFGVVLFAISGVFLETVEWYSASSFTWSLLFALVSALSCRAAQDAESVRRRVLWVAIASLGALASPGFSAIGLLAGPFATLVCWTKSAPPATRWFGSAPVAGTLLYLALVVGVGHNATVARSVRDRVDLAQGVVSSLRGPIEVLLPGLVGAEPAFGRIPSGISAFSGGVILLGAAVLAWRSRARAAAIGGVFLVFGGYFLTCAARGDVGPLGPLAVQRYHLFPQLGLAIVLAVLCRPWIGRFDAPSPRSRVIAVLFSLVLIVVHWPSMQARARCYRFPEQRATLTALDHLRDVCVRERITRDQALRVLDPIRPRWFAFDLPVQPLMMLGPAGEVAAHPDAVARERLIQQLPAADRLALCGAMDATRYLESSRDSTPDATLAVGRFLKRYSNNPADARSFMEYEFTPSSPSFLAITLPADSRELWWADARGRWSESRSIHWRADPKRAGAALSVRLDRLPHCDRSRFVRVRLGFQTSDPAEHQPPRLIR